MTKTLTFSNESARKCYETGLRIVREKLSGHHKLTLAEREAATVARGKAEVLKKLGAAGFRRCFGHEPPRAMAAPAVKPPAPAQPIRKTYAAPEQPQRTFHRFKTGHGLFA